MMQNSTNLQVLRTEAVGKNKKRVYFDNGLKCLFYISELRRYRLYEGEYITEQEYDYLLKEILTKRAKKRALYLLEKMDRTEQQLREKLLLNEYPMECIDAAILYVKKFHYIDDFRYACNYIRYHQEKSSLQQLKQKLIGKGVGREHIQLAFEQEYSGNERLQIKNLLIKKHYMPVSRNTVEFRRIYQFLLRRGFSSQDILKEMSLMEENQL